MDSLLAHYVVCMSESKAVIDTQSCMWIFMSSFIHHSPRLKTANVLQWIDG